MKFKIVENIYINNLLINLIVLAPAIIGINIGNDSLILMSVIILGIVGYSMSLMLLVPTNTLVDAVKRKLLNKQTQSDVLAADIDEELLLKANDKKYITLNVVYDIFVAFGIGYVGYPLTGAVYALHILGYLKCYQVVCEADRQVKKEKEY